MAPASGSLAQFRTAPLCGCSMSRVSLSAILALLLAVPLASGTSEGFLAAKTLESSQAVRRAQTKDEDDDDDDDSQVNAFTPVSEAEEVEANGDDAEEAEDDDAQAPDETEPEEVGFDNAAAETESQNEDADEETGSD